MSLSQNLAGSFAGERWIEPALLAAIPSQLRWLSIARTARVMNAGRNRILLGRVITGQSRAASLVKQFAREERAYWGGFTHLGSGFEYAAGRLGARGLSVSAGHILEFSFLMDRVSPGLAKNFTVGAYLGGGIADAIIGGGVQLWQDRDDPTVMAAAANDPTLLARRVLGASATNATIGVASAGAVHGVLAAAAWFGVSTPPGWAIGLGIVAAATYADITWGDQLEERFFTWLNARVKIDE
jgi:hypothetical protein